MTASAASPVLQLTVPAESGAARRLRIEADRFLGDGGVTEPDRDRVRLAVSEAVTNVVLHAYRGRARAGPVHLLVELSPTLVRVSVGDEGGGMTPRPDSPGAGLGLPVIASLVDDLGVSGRDGASGTEVRMTFALTRPG